MEALFTSISSVALAEIGDKTQLLALFLATRFRSKTAIVMGILIATLVNHAVSAWLGNWVAAWLPEFWVTLIVGISFILVGLWLLIPDEDEEQSAAILKLGAFTATLILFFIAEIGDKTQIATVLLGAHYEDTLAVVTGSTLGMLLANVPVVFAGAWVMQHIDAKKARWGACALFIIMGLVTVGRAFWVG